MSERKQGLQTREKKCCSLWEREDHNEDSTRGPRKAYRNEILGTSDPGSEEIRYSKAAIVIRRYCREKVVSSQRSREKVYSEEKTARFLGLTPLLSGASFRGSSVFGKRRGELT